MVGEQKVLVNVYVDIRHYLILSIIQRISIIRPNSRSKTARNERLSAFTVLAVYSIDRRIHIRVIVLGTHPCFSEL